MWVPRFSLATFVAGAALAVSAHGQSVLRSGPGGGPLNIVTSDLAVLSAGDDRRDLPCEVEPLTPKLEYDLNFVAGYNAIVPLRELTGSGTELRILFRIQEVDGRYEPVYFRKSFTVPPIEAEAEGSASLPGQYRLGPGRYRVDWLMRDRAERVCARSWEVAAETPEGFEKLGASPLEGLIAEVDEETFYEEPPVRRAPGNLLRVKLLVNFSPEDLSDPSLRPYDIQSIVAMLRALSREPTLGEFDLVAYSMHEERVFYEENRSPRISFAKLGEALDALEGGVVDIARLQDEQSGQRFVQSLFESHLAGPADAANASDAPDVVIWLGPKVILQRSPESSLLSSAQRLNVPVFYLIYNRNPRSYPWKGAVSAGLKGFGAEEFDITRPRDFGAALQRILDRLSKLRTPADS